MCVILVTMWIHRISLCGKAHVKPSNTFHVLELFIVCLPEKRSGLCYGNDADDGIAHYSWMSWGFECSLFHPFSNVKAIQKINEAELRLGGGSKSSWHDEYSDSAYVFIGM